jgi:hypothetical protein
MTGSSSFWFANPGSSFYNNAVTRSLKIDDGTDARLSRTLGTATNRAKYTLSWWMKVGDTMNTGSSATIFDSGSNGANYSFIYLNNGKTLACNGVSGGSNVYALGTNDSLRDPTSWYHCMFIYDSAQATDTNRIYFIVNGTRLTSTTGSPTYPTQSTNDPYWNNSNAHYIGYGGGAVAVGDFDGYLADIYHIDGQALDADDFTELKNGVRIPKAYEGSYGNNGFHIAFASGTGTGTASSSTIGADTSGNDLHFTTTNIVSNDVVLDSPEVNFAVLNPVYRSGGTPTLSEGNLKLTGSGTDYDRTYATVGITSGQWYAEFYYVSGDNRGMFGIVREDSQYLYAGGASNVNGTYIGAQLNTYGIDFRARAYTNSTQLFDQTNFDTGDIGLLCFDVDNGKLWFGRRDVSGSTTIWYDSSGNNNGDPSAGSNPTYTFTATGHTWFIGCHDYDGTTIIANFGQDGTFNGSVTSVGATDANGIGDFNYIESGFSALCTANLSEPTLGPNSDELPNQHYQNHLFTGDSSSTRTISGLNFQPDFLWSKTRNQGFTHRLYDSTRGADKGFKIGDGANLYAIESTDDIFDGFTSDGYKTTTDSSSGDLLNYNTGTYINWLWKANGGTTTTNDASATSVGDIDSVHQANTTAGFSIVQYTGTGSAGGIAHGLGAVPHFILIKNRTHNTGNGSGTNWVVYHKDMDETEPQDYSLYISTAGRGDYVGMFNDTAPTSTTFTVGTHMTVNSGDPNYYMAYVWTEIENFSKFGIYHGNGSTDGPSIFLGFRPALVVVKNRDTTGSWAVSDSARSPFNEIANTLLWDDDASESGVSNDLNVDFLSNGFKIRDSNSHYNTNQAEYVYAAWAEMPAKYANAF